MSEALDYLQSKNLPLKAAGTTNVNTPCIFCSEDPGKRGRLYVNVSGTDDDGLYFCHLCGSKGNLRTMRRHFGDPVESESDDTSHLRTRILSDAAAYYHEHLPLEVLQWLVDERGLEHATIQQHELGWADGKLLGYLRDERGLPLKEILETGLVVERNGRYVDFLHDQVTIPYHVANSVVMIRGKHLGGKYQTPPGQKTRLFNSDSTWGSDEVLIAEGEFDALILEQMGYKAVACPGANVWQESWTGYFIDTKTVYVLFDNDSAGELGAKKIKDYIGHRAKIVTLPDEGLPPGENDVTNWVVKLGATKQDFEALLNESVLANSLLVTVDQAFSEWLELQGAEGIRFGYEKLDAAIQPGLIPGQVCVVLAKTNTGKGGPLWSRILTPSGWTTYGEVKEGDLVVGADGRSTKVVGVFPRGVLQTYRVRFSDGAEVVVDGEHLWAVRRRQHRYRDLPCITLDTEDLKTRVERGEDWWIPMVEPVEFEAATDLPLDPYLLGVLLGDGCIKYGTELSSADEQLLDFVRAVLPEGMRLVKFGPYDYRLSGRQGLANPVREVLRKLDLYGRGSREKFIPDVYLWASAEERLGLLQGLMDTDGSVDKRQGALEFGSTSRALAEGVQFLVESLGGNATVRERENAFGAVFKVRIATNQQVFRLDRKRQLVRPRTRTLERRIVSIEPAAREEVVCIAVDAPDHLYVTERFVVTHNTMFLLNMFQRMSHEHPDAKIMFVSLEQTRGDWFERARRLWNFYNVDCPSDQVSKETLDYWRERLLIVDRNRISEEQLLTSIDEFEMQMGEPPSVIAIDYLGYWASSFKASSRYERVTDAIMSLKAVAKDRRIPIVTPHQVSRMAEFGMELSIDQARDSGAVEETADLVLALWAPDTAAGRDPSEFENRIVMKIGKSRHGGKGTIINLKFAPLTLTIVQEEERLAKWAVREGKYLKRAQTWEQAITNHRTGRDLGAPQADVGDVDF